MSMPMKMKMTALKMVIYRKTINSDLVHRKHYHGKKIGFSKKWYDYIKLDVIVCFFFF